MTMSAQQTQPQSDATLDSVTEWLHEKVAFYLEEPAEAIKRDGKLVEYGLDSIYALTLCGEIEDEYGIEVKPTLVWDYPTVDALAGLVVELIAAQQN